MYKAEQEMPQTLRGRMYRRDAYCPRERRVLVLQTGVAGLLHYAQSEEEQAELRAIAPGTELLLFREPENEHDRWAIAVYLTEERKIGFISRFKNETIARLMDAGKRFVAVVDDPAADPAAQKIVEKEQLRRGRRAPTESMALPLSVYLIEEG